MATNDNNQMMKQWQFTKSGSPRDVLKMVEVAIPTTCTEDEVLVQISHVSFNTAIVYRLIAHYGIMDPVGAFLGRPCVPEMDFSGIVCDLRGANVKEFQTGDRVFGIGEPRFGDVSQGVLREYVLIKHQSMIKIPANISFKDASCFPATGYTAYCFLVEKCHLKEGQRVFINGGSGAVGVMAIQLARTIVGPTGLVVATCTPAKSDVVQSLGVDEIIDYTSHYLPDYLRDHYRSRPFDIIVDTVGIDHTLYSHSPDYLAPSGSFCTVGMVEIGSTVWSFTKRITQLLSAIFLPVYLGGVPRKHVFEPLNTVPSRFVALAQLVEERAFKAVIDSTYKFSDVLDAYDRVMSRKVIGKVVVEVNDMD